jgi:hypothetical protein
VKLLLTATLSFALPSAAMAQGMTGECLWDSLPPASQDRILVVYGERGSDGVLDDKAVPSPTSILTCGGYPVDRPAATGLGAKAAKIFIPTKIERAARNRLIELGYPGATLDRAWSDLTPAQRVTLRNAGQGMISGKGASNPALITLILDTAETIGIDPDAPDYTKRAQIFAEFLMTRAAREYFEAIP